MLSMLWNSLRVCWAYFECRFCEMGRDFPLCWPALVSSSAAWPHREVPLSQKYPSRSSCVRTATSDPDLEAEVRFPPRLVLDGVVYLGEALWRGVGGLCPACPVGGGGDKGGACAPSPLSPASLERGYRARIFKCLWGPGIDSKERIPPPM
jgi:hypothetical protein